MLKMFPMKYEKDKTNNCCQSEQQVALTLYGDAIHGPRDEGFGRAAGSAGQHSVLSRSHYKVSWRATDPIRGSWK